MGRSSYKRCLLFFSLALSFTLSASDPGTTRKANGREYNKCIMSNNAEFYCPKITISQRQREYFDKVKDVVCPAKAIYFIGDSTTRELFKSFSCLCPETPAKFKFVQKFIAQAYEGVLVHTQSDIMILNTGLWWGNDIPKLKHELTNLSNHMLTNMEKYPHIKHIWLTTTAQHFCYKGGYDPPFKGSERTKIHEENGGRCCNIKTARRIPFDFVNQHLIQSTGAEVLDFYYFTSKLWDQHTYFRKGVDCTHWCNNPLGPVFLMAHQLLQHLGPEHAQQPVSLGPKPWDGTFEGLLRRKKWWVEDLAFAGPGSGPPPSTQPESKKQPKAQDGWIW